MSPVPSLCRLARSLCCVLLCRSCEALPLFFIFTCALACVARCGTTVGTCLAVYGRSHVLGVLLVRLSSLVSICAVASLLLCTRKCVFAIPRVQKNIHCVASVGRTASGPAVCGAELRGISTPGFFSAIYASFQSTAEPTSFD